MVLISMLVLVGACSTRSAAGGQAVGPDATGDRKALGSAASAGESSSFVLSSSAFQDGEAIPSRYTCDGNDRSPPLAWAGIPPDAASLALIVEDPDAPGGTWFHWVVYGLQPEMPGLTDGIGGSSELAGFGVSGVNSWGEQRYGGPCPPSGLHHYRFSIYALDGALGEPAGMTASELRAAINGHVLAEAYLTGTYSR